MKHQWGRGEKWLFISSGFFCLPLLAGSWIYERQNELPPLSLQVAEIPPACNGFDLVLQAVATLPTLVPSGLYNSPSNWAGYRLPYGKGYPNLYSKSLALWRQSLEMPLYVPENPDSLWDSPAQLNRWNLCDLLTQKAKVQALAYWQQGDRASALNWLLAVHRAYCREATSFYNGSNHPRGYSARRNSIKARAALVRDFKQLMPYLKAAELLYVARGLQRNRTLVPSIVETVEAIKSRHMARVYRWCARNDLRLADNEKSPELSRLSSTEQLQFRWANKRLVMQKIENQCDWVVSQAKMPANKRESQYPDNIKPKSGDPLCRLTFNNNIINEFSEAETLDAHEIVLLTAMAVRAFELEKGHLPHNLDELPPNYLQKVDDDPFRPTHPLCYLPKPKTYKQLYLGKPIYTQNLPLGAILPPAPIPDTGNILRPSNIRSKLPPVTGYYLTQVTRKLPFLLYSVGQNGCDEGGMDFRAIGTKITSSGRIFPSRSDDILAKADCFKVSTLSGNYLAPGGPGP